MASLLNPESTAWEQAISPLRELGAYEALWDRPGVWFKDISKLFSGDRDALLSHFIDAKTADKYSRAVLAEFEEAKISSFDIQVGGMWEYPANLAETEYPVRICYSQGWWGLVEAPCVSVVGTRNPSEEGKAQTRKLVRALVKDGFVIVSGLARGIDTVAHETALRSGGRTIGVLGTPLSCSYPKENSDLQRRIAKEHLLVSQVPVMRYKKQSLKYNKLFFPERNKLMSALSRATIIVEAGETSGTLVQARAALNHDRPLFILDNCLSGSLKWPKRFLERGAIRVKGYDDIQAKLSS